jgi:glutaredoxin 2
MKLYVYEHCPYCVRPRIVADINQLDYELIILANDDEQSHFDLIDKKIVPIFQDDDGSCMTESLDICEYLDQIKGNSLFQQAPDENNIMSNIEQLYAAAKVITYPRMVYHPMNQADFPTQSALNYFKTKKEKSLGIQFKEAIQNSENYTTEVQAYLDALNEQFVYQYAVSDTLSKQDIMAFSWLRTITIAKDVLSIPKNIENYLLRIAAQTNIKLYDTYHFRDS